MAEEALTPEFLEFYQAYPRKEARRAALKAFIAAKKRSASQSEIMAGVRSYCAWIAMTNKEMRYICQPATWLNQDRWADVLEVPKPKVIASKTIVRPFKWIRTPDGMAKVYEDTH